METVTLTIDGRPVTVEKGKTVLQAAIESGDPVPYYCYHPGIGVDGSCRVCIVKIEKMPKLQTSCSTLLRRRHGRLDADRRCGRRRAPGVFEFLLVNHPLDCPVCDKGGECPLQDFSYNFGPDQSRMEFPRRVFDGEGVKGDVDFGPTLMLNRQRCILCTRCVRFMRDVEGDAQINIIDRGYGSEIATFQEEGVHSLISGNLMDVCPGRRDHHARLPLQVAAVGQRHRRRHHLHDVLEGLQHDGLDEGQARVGEGLAPHPLHAPAQPGGQRLLDVRHRPLRLSLDRGRRSPPPSSRARRSGRPAAVVVARPDAQAPRSPRDGRTVEPRRRALPALGARVTRGAVPVPAGSPRNSSASPRRTTRPSASAGDTAPRTSPSTRRSRCRPSMHRTSRARGDGIVDARRRRPASVDAPAPTSRPCAQRSKPAASPRSTSSTPGPTARSAT